MTHNKAFTSANSSCRYLQSVVGVIYTGLCQSVANGLMRILRAASVDAFRQREGWFFHGTGASEASYLCSGHFPLKGRDMAENEFDKQALVNWLLIPERGFENNVIYGGSNRPFESVRNAIRFVMEDLPRQQRPTAEIRTEAGRVFKADEIAKLYRAAEFKNS